MRAQPLHLGHARVINRMLAQCEHVTILLGSAQEHGTDKNPFSYFERRAMLRNVFGDSITVSGINDINRPDLWPEYIMGCALTRFPKLPAPDAYYAGSGIDAAPFAHTGMHIEIEVRNDLSGTKLRAIMDEGFNHWKNWVDPSNYLIVENYIKNKKRNA